MLVRFAVLLGLLGAGGCGLVSGSSRAHVGPISSVNDILERCAGVYQRATTMSARGIFRDFRNERHRVERIEWQLARPDRKRFQLGLDAAIAVGNGCWTYKSDGDGFRRVQDPSPTPMVRLSYVMSGGVSFLVPALFETGDRAFEHGTLRRENPWVLSGVNWRDGHPCYVVAQDHAGGTPGRILRVWIDQDSFLVRAWTLHAPDAQGRLVPILGCSYEEVLLDEPVDPELFQLQRPMEIRLLSDEKQKR